jgi:ubiquitin C-terminal hydrolase
MKKKNGTTIDECFKLFEEPEILAEDNAWYCPKCKDFVLAKKQMQIYKAPKILIVCLKRFKRK